MPRRIRITALTIAAALVIITVAWIAGRPHPLTDDATTRELQAISGELAQARLVIQLTVDGRAFERTTTVRAEETAEALRASAVKLRLEGVPERRREAMERGVRIADDVADDMERWSSMPGSVADARRLVAEIESRQADFREVTGE